MRRIIRCGKCSLCAVYTPCGFISVPELICTRTGEVVEDDDGCTFGQIGGHQIAVVPYDVYSNHDPEPYY